MKYYELERIKSRHLSDDRNALLHKTANFLI